MTEEQEYKAIVRIQKFLVFLAIVFVFLYLLSGCASERELQLGYNSQRDIIRFQTERKIEPMVDFSCGTESDPCKNVKLIVRRPAPDIQVPHVTNSNDAISNVMPQIITGIGYVAGAVAATKIFSDMSEGMGGNNVSTHNTSVISGDNNTNGQTTSITKSTADNNVIDNTAPPTIVDPVIVK